MSSSSPPSPLSPVSCVLVPVLDPAVPLLDTRPIAPGDTGEGVLHVVCNPQSLQFGKQMDGQWTARHLTLTTAICGVMRGCPNTISHLSPIVTHLHDSASVLEEDVAHIIDASIRFILIAPASVVILYGAKVRAQLTPERLHRLVPGAARSEARSYGGLSFCVLSTPAHACWLIESPDPAYKARKGRVYAAVQLAYMLTGRARPPAANEVVELSSVERRSIRRWRKTAAFIHGPEEVAEDDWEQERAEDEQAKAEFDRGQPSSRGGRGEAAAAASRGRGRGGS